VEPQIDFWVACVGSRSPETLGLDDQFSGKLGEGSRWSGAWSGITCARTGFLPHPRRPEFSLSSICLAR